MSSIKRKKKPCSNCKKPTYGRLCNSCEAKRRIEKAKSTQKKKAQNRAKEEELPKAVKKPKSRTRKKKSPKVGVIKKHCYDLYSLFIRMRDSGEDGIGECITCTKRCFFYDNCADNGHFFSRKLMSCAFHPHNNNLQCSYCNGPGNGKQYEYSLAVDQKWGEGTATSLLELSRKTQKWTFIDYLSLLKDTLPICYEQLKGKTIPPEVHDKVESRLDFYKRYINRVDIREKIN